MNRQPRTTAREPPPTRGRRGFTLMELMVSVAILAVFGLALLVLLRQSLELWRTAEAQRRVSDGAAVVLGQLDADLGAVATRRHRTRPNPDVRFLADLIWNAAGTHAHTRLRFVRTLPDGEDRHALAGASGELPLSAGAVEYLTLHDDAAKQIVAGADFWSALRPLGDRAEVLYGIGPEDDSTRLWRGLRAPAGGPAPQGDFPATGSFFDLPDYEPDADGWSFDQVYHPLAAGVLHFGVEFWYEGDRADPGWYGLDRYPGLDPPGLWDSEVRGFPAALRVVLVLATPGQPFATSLVAADLDERADALAVQDAGLFPPASGKEPAFVRVDGEWISYRGKTGAKLTGLERGRRGTSPAPHPAGALLEGDHTAGHFDVTTTLAADLGPSASGGLRVASAAGLPAPGTEGACVQVDREWIAYAAREGDELLELKRGRRASKVEAHRRGAPVIAGRTFVRVYRLPTVPVPEGRGPE